jgi:hypothetical protein
LIPKILQILRVNHVAVDTGKMLRTLEITSKNIVDLETWKGVSIKGWRYNV